MAKQKKKDENVYGTINGVPYNFTNIAGKKAEDFATEMMEAHSANHVIFGNRDEAKRRELMLMVHKTATDEVNKRNQKEEKQDQGKQKPPAKPEDKG